MLTQPIPMYVATYHMVHMIIKQFCNLQRLMKMKADGCAIVNNEWTSGTLNNKKPSIKPLRSCDGIQSLTLDNSAM